MLAKFLFVLALVFGTAGSAVMAQRKPAANPAAPAPSPSPSPADTEILAPFKGRHAWLISESGIGVAKIGMPVAVLKHKLGDKLVIENVAAVVGDFDAIRISLEGEHLFYLLHVPDFIPAKVGDIMTNNPRFSTTEGLRPGMTIEEAEKIYGKAIFFYSENNDAEEFVTFENQPFPNLRVRPKAVNQAKVGIYAPKQQPVPTEPPTIGNAADTREPDAVEGQVFSTDKFHPGAVIDSITVTSSGD